MEIKQQSEGGAEQGNVLFNSTAKKTVMQLRANGEIIVRGEVVDTNPDVLADWRSVMSKAETSYQAPTASTEGSLAFTMANKEVLRFVGDDAYVRGEKVDDNWVVYKAFREWLRLALAPKPA